MGSAIETGSYRTGELAADRSIHLIGSSLGVVGSVVLLGLTASAANGATFAASLVYSVSLLTMLGCSAAYNLAITTSRRALLRRFDHAAIFLMIAGTYTPFTICRLHGAWAIGMTATVWIGAGVGAVIKLVHFPRLERLSIAAYLGLGWIILVALRPLLAAVDATSVVLIATGGTLYSIGTVFHVWRSLPFHNAIWHVFVLFAVACHYAAILHGVVLARP